MHSRPLFTIWRYSRKAKNRRHRDNLVRSELKQLVAGMFRPDLLEANTIADDEPLMGGRMGLDSIDALELAICVEEEFGIAISRGAEFLIAFKSVTTLADFIQSRARSPVRSGSAAPASPL